MTDKELENFRKEYNNLPTSGWISKKDSNGGKEWNHYYFHDTTKEVNSNFWIFVISFFIIWIMTLFGF
jgi:hypothetical protein